MTDNGLQKLYIKTPLLESIPLSKLTGLPVYLKCENTQPSGSFKIRGLGYKVQQSFLSGSDNLVTASGGNAGLAMAYSARQLGIKATIIIPETSPKTVAGKLRDLGAEVTVHSQSFDEANELALKIASQPGFTYIHPYDDPVIWEGHTPMIEEIKEQLGGVKPRCVVVAVGGGGLLLGVVQGLQKFGWGDVPVVAMETYGAESFNKAIEKKELIMLPAITSICHTLGARQVCRRLFEVVMNKEHKIISELVTDNDALNAVHEFLDHHRFMVEPSCGAGLAAIYTGLIERLVKEKQIPSEGPVVVIVCGGSGSTLGQLREWREQLAAKISDRQH